MADKDANATKQDLTDLKTDLKESFTETIKSELRIAVLESNKELTAEIVKTNERLAKTEFDQDKQSGKIKRIFEKLDLFIDALPSLTTKVAGLELVVSPLIKDMKEYKEIQIAQGKTLALLVGHRKWLYGLIVIVGILSPTAIVLFK